MKKLFRDSPERAFLSDRDVQFPQFRAQLLHVAVENLPSEQVSVLSEDPGTVQKHLRIEAVQDLPHVKYDVSNHTTLTGASQNSSLPSAIHLPPLRSKSMTLSPEMLKRIFSPILKSVLPKTTPVSRKSPTRTLIVDSMPVGMAP